MSAELCYFIYTFIPLDAFRRWRQENEKVYGSKKEEELRYEAFRANVKKINILNDIYK